MVRKKYFAETVRYKDRMKNGRERGLNSYLKPTGATCEVNPAASAYRSNRI